MLTDVCWQMLLLHLQSVKHTQQQQLVKQKRNCMSCCPGQAFACVLTVCAVVCCAVYCGYVQALEVCAEKKKRILLIQQEIRANPVSHKRTGRQLNTHTRLLSWWLLDICTGSSTVATGHSRSFCLYCQQYHQQQPRSSPRCSSG